MKYYYLEDNTAKGPFSVKQLCNIKITSDTMVSTNGSDHWVKASTVPELSEAIRKTTERSIKLFVECVSFLCLVVGGIILYHIWTDWTDSMSKSMSKNINNLSQSLISAANEISPESSDFKNNRSLVEQKPNKPQGLSNSRDNLVEQNTGSSLSGKRLTSVYVTDCEIEEDEVGDFYESFVFVNDREFVWFWGGGPLTNDELTAANKFYYGSESYGGTYRMEGEVFILTVTTKTEAKYKIHSHDNEGVENLTEIEEPPARTIRISKKNCGNNTFFTTTNKTREFYFSISSIDEEDNYREILESLKKHPINE